MEGQITIGLPYKARCTLSGAMVRQKSRSFDCVSGVASDSTHCAQDDILLWMTMAKG